MSSLFIVGASFTKGLLRLVAALAFTSLGALLSAAAIQGLLQCVVLLWYVRLRFPGPVWAFDRRLFWTQLGYALPFGFAGLVYRLEMDLHNYVVSYKFGPAAYALTRWDACSCR